MLVFLNRPRRPRPALLNERGQGLAVLLAALAVLLAIVVAARGMG